jgi:hypothetical protein
LDRWRRAVLKLKQPAGASLAGALLPAPGGAIVAGHQFWDYNLIRQLMVAVSDQQNPQLEVKSVASAGALQHIHVPAF